MLQVIPLKQTSGDGQVEERSSGAGTMEVTELSRPHPLLLLINHGNRLLRCFDQRPAECPLQPLIGYFRSHFSSCLSFAKSLLFSAGRIQKWAKSWSPDVLNAGDPRTISNRQDCSSQYCFPWVEKPFPALQSNAWFVTVSFQNQCHLFSTLRTLGLHSIHSRSNWCHTECWALISIRERAVIGLLGSEWFAVSILAKNCGRYKWFFLFVIQCLLELNLLTSRDCLVFSRTLGYISNRPQAYPDTKALKQPWLMTLPAAFRPLSLVTSF